LERVDSNLDLGAFIRNPAETEIEMAPTTGHVGANGRNDRRQEIPLEAMPQENPA